MTHDLSWYDREERKEISIMSFSTVGKIVVGLSVVALGSAFTLHMGPFKAAPELNTPSIVDSLVEGDYKTEMDGIQKLCFPTKQQYDAIGLNKKLCTRFFKQVNEDEAGRDLPIDGLDAGAPKGLTDVGQALKAQAHKKAYKPGSLNKTLADKMADAPPVPLPGEGY